MELGWDEHQKRRLQEGCQTVEVRASPAQPWPSEMWSFQNSRSNLGSCYGQWDGSATPLGRLEDGEGSTDKTLKGLWQMLRKISPGRLLSHHSGSSWGLREVPAHGQDNTICFTGCPPPATAGSWKGPWGGTMGTHMEAVCQR